MRINIEDFANSAREAVTQQTGLWPIFDYEIVSPEEDDDPYELFTPKNGMPVDGKLSIAVERQHPFIRAKPWRVTEEDKQPPDNEVVRELYPVENPGLLTTAYGHHFANEPQEVYRPLSYPDLFLQFARLPEDGEITADTVLEWAGTYGLLGLDTSITPLGHGGSAEMIWRFESEARDACVALTFYEAATAPQEPDAQTLREVWANPPDLPPAQLKDRALEHVEDLTHEKMHEWCYPKPLLRDGSNSTRGYGFKSLLGAMWLQMFWLLTSDNSGPRCAWCGGVLSIDPLPQEPAKSTRRKDARYCRGGACKQAHWRHKRASDKRG